MSARRFTSSLRRLAGRRRADRRLLLRAGVAVLACRAALARVRLQRLARLTAGVPSRGHTAESPARIAWAVRTAGQRLLGDSSCLPQALAARLLLARDGYASHLRVGLARDAQGQMTGHAWLEVDGHVLLGDESSELCELPLDEMEGFGGTWA